MAKRNEMKLAAIQTNSAADWKKYKISRNRVNNEIKKAKRSYYEKQFVQSSNNPRMVWSTINELLSRKKLHKIHITEIKNNQTSVFDSTEIAEVFNAHFSNIGEVLANAIPNGSSTFSDYLPKISTVFTLQQTTTKEICNVIKSIDSKKATALDGISARLVKLGIPIISDSLVKIFNQSVQKGIFPDDLKLAKVIPIFKNGEKDNVNNYRPISILPVVAIQTNF